MSEEQLNATKAKQVFKPQTPINPAFGMGAMEPLLVARQILSPLKLIKPAA